MSRVRVKICGVMRVEDAVQAVHAGADAIGMVFYPAARRCVQMVTARDIVQHLPALVTAVGLFVNQSVEEIRAICQATGINTIQLHGNESPAIVEQLREFSVIKMFKCDPETIRAELQTWKLARTSLPNWNGLLLETPGHAAGGTGIENNWDLIHQLQQEKQFDDLPPLIVAGGLNVQNVGNVGQNIKPFAVDVSSGVEETFGQKSPEKMVEFINRAQW